MIGKRLLALGAAALLAGCSRSAALDRLSAGETGRVVEVREGDDLVLDSGLEVRLAGVEAPHAAAPGAQAARDALAHMVQGQEVVLLYGGARRDRYGRAIAQARVKRSGVWVQDALLSEGQVRVHTWPDNVALAGPMLGAEAAGRIAHKGLWAMPVYRVLLPSEARDDQGFAVIEGRVAKVTETAGQAGLISPRAGRAL